MGLVVVVATFDDRVRLVVIEQKRRNRELATRGVLAEVPDQQSRVQQVTGSENVAVTASGPSKRTRVGTSCVPSDLQLREAKSTRPSHSGAFHVCTHAWKCAQCRRAIASVGGSKDTVSGQAPPPPSQSVQLRAHAVSRRRRTSSGCFIFLGSLGDCSPG